MSEVHGVATQGAQQECSAFAAQYLATLKQNASTTRMLGGALVDKDALRHGMCIGVVASQRGTVGLGYLHQNLASLLSGAPNALNPFLPETFSRVSSHAEYVIAE